MSHRKGPKKDNKKKQWTKDDIQKLGKLAKGNTPTDLIADALGRTPSAIYSKAYQKSITLRPTNKSPYNRRKKK